MRTTPWLRLVNSFTCRGYTLRPTGEIRNTLVWELKGPRPWETSSGMSTLERRPAYASYLWRSVILPLPTCWLCRRCRRAGPDGPSFIRPPPPPPPPTNNVSATLALNDNHRRVTSRLILSWYRQRYFLRNLFCFSFPFIFYVCWELNILCRLGIHRSMYAALFGHDGGWLSVVTWRKARDFTPPRAYLLFSRETASNR